ncbi:MAG TPA: phosphoribosylformylglycinamidine cyclo-ligase, partial [Rubricoccaceae bacterium]
DDVLDAVVGGIAKACRENGCALVGGETAEMPDLYRPGEYDLAGTVVGVVERDGVVDGTTIQPGDVLLGLPSTGLHTNGYSLARQVLFGRFDASDEPDALGGESVADALLRVHRSYLDAIQALVSEGLAGGFAHITGGGLVSNTRRILPAGLDLDVAWDAWTRPSLFRLIQDVGSVPEDDMRRTFNLGVGLVAVVPQANVARALAVLGSLGEPAFEVGRVVAGGGG